MESALKAIADPNRRHILELVAQAELTAGEIAQHFDVTRPAISQHLTVLKNAGLVTERRVGPRRLYRTREQGFAAAKLFLEGFWDDRLGRLRRVAESPSTEIVERVSVQRELVIPAPPEQVWELLTDPDKATSWMGMAARFELSPGGEYRVEVVPDQVVVGEFVVIDPPHRLAHTWGWESDDDVVPVGSTIVIFDLTLDESGTLLRVTHQELPTLPSAGSHSRGWGHYLERLAALAAGESVGPDPWIDPEILMTELRP